MKPAAFLALLGSILIAVSVLLIVISNALLGQQTSATLASVPPVVFPLMSLVTHVGETIGAVLLAAALVLRYGTQGLPHRS